MHQFQTPMLSAHISSWRASSVHASVPYAHAQRVLKEHFQNWNLYAYAEHTHKKLMHVLRISISSWCDMLSIFWRHCSQRTHQFLMRMLSTRTSSWLVCSAYTSVPDVHAQCTHQFLTRMLRVYKINIWKMGKLIHTLSMRIRYWCVWSGCTMYISSSRGHSGCASVPDP